jgi:hypothetical protein
MTIPRPNDTDLCELMSLRHELAELLLLPVILNYAVQVMTVTKSSLLSYAHNTGHHKCYLVQKQ